MSPDGDLALQISVALGSVKENKKIMRLSIVTFAKYHDVTPDFYAIIRCKRKYAFSIIFFFFRLRICVYLCFILLYTIIICVLFYYILLQMCFFGAVDDDSVVNKGMVSDSTVLDELTEWVVTFLQENSNF